MKINHFVVLTCCFLMLAVCGSVAQQAPTVTVKAHQVSQPDGTVLYQYRVINGGTKRIVALRIGYDYYHGVPELDELPVGWDPDAGNPGVIGAPASWRGRVITTEESQYFEVQWRNDRTADIFGGQTADDFSVVTPKADTHYLNGHWTVIFGDSTIESALLVPDDNPASGDTTPPSITVALTPNSLWPPNGRMLAITANISVHDDVDPNPVVKLVSITCNEQLGDGDISGAGIGMDSRSFSLRATRLGTDKVGRIYTITYSATDFSGNTAAATATVSVPHDQRK